MSVRVGNDIVAGSTSDQLISTAIETHNRDANAHADIRASISAATPVVDLGEISEASFEVNKNYAASVSEPAAFTLPTPTDTTIANKITVNLTVLVASTIDWGANANASVTQFEPGKYQIRFLWNNNSSAWTAEVLKENEASSLIKLLVRFNGDMVDESASPITLTPSLQNENFPIYTEGQYGQKKLVCNQDFVSGIHLIASGDNLSKLNLGTGDFTIKYWISWSDYGKYIFKKDNSNYISIKYNSIEIKFNGTTIVNKSGTFASYNSISYVAITRHNGVLYIFINGTLVHTQSSTEEWDLSGFTRIFDEVRSGNSIQELIIKSTCDYVANFTVPSSPFVLSDNGVSDLHDDTLATKTELAEYVKLSTKGIANGVASLDANGKVPLSQLPDNIGGGGGGAAPTLKWYKNNTGSSITIDDTSSSSRVKVYKNGVLLEPEEDYSISGTTLVLITNLTINDKITTEVF